MCNGKVIFVSQREAETIHPEPGVAMISITDPGKPLAELGSWELIYRDSFFDGGYSEDAIHIHKDEFRMRYCSYIDSEQGEKLKNFISQLISSGVNKIYVHCYFGRSRSGAVAKYLVDQFGFESNKPIESPNMTVYKLLCNPVRFEPLIQQYEQAAKAPKEEKQPTISQKFVDLLMVALGLKK
ncbi:MULTISPECIES: protein-tyrosine phosphatase family protein [Vibrio]|uniref:dual specificity protein phosphatase family protein n=1 Tax=Vibrio TaxID=662 RepID=UPI000BBAFE19|nr:MULTISPECIES: dual specificity protein phosphatase family protein [Vibrio]MCA4005067.1 dual specificity protein phosphatase family protein [Vibrio vulnificus]PCD86745.1 hypothetical protein COR52_19255 [Vibrio mediterranei]HDM8198161.1 dual specificity protein phosphatase family protein [Vibrio harveyi]